MKKLVIALIVVFAMLIAADFAAAATAEYQVSQRMRTQLQLPEDPAVRIHGFPFLAQVAAGDYRDVELQASSVHLGQFSELELEANLRHAKLAASDVLGGTANKIDVGELAGRVKLKASDVGRFLGITDLRIDPAPKDALSGTGDDPTGNGQPGTTVDPTKTTVALNGTVNIAGTNNKVIVVAVLSLLNGQLKIEPRKLDIDNSTWGPIPLPKPIEKSVLQQFATTLDPGMLPFKVTPTAVRTEHGALVVEGTATNVTVDANGLSSR